MEFHQVVKKRRSIRAYKDAPVEQEKLDRVLEAARLAPSAANRQPYQFYVVRDDETRKRLLEAYSQEWFVQAPVIVCACTLPEQAWERVDGKNYADVDVSIAMEHLVLAAAAEGLGTCWIGAFHPSKLRDALQIPPELEPVAMTPLGYPAKKPGPTTRKPLGEIVEYR